MDKLPTSTGYRISEPSTVCSNEIHCAVIGEMSLPNFRTAWISSEPVPSKIDVWHETQKLVHASYTD